MNQNANIDVHNTSNNEILINDESENEFLMNLSLSKINVCDMRDKDLSMENSNNTFEGNMNVNNAIDDKNIEENVKEYDLKPKNNPLNVGENWGGKITPDKEKTKRPTYMDPFPDWDLVQSHKFVNMPLLRNGNLCDSIKLKNKYVCVRNTCAFDSVVQLLSHAIGKEKFYKNVIEDSQLPVLKLAQNILIHGKITVNDYKIRTNIL